MAEFDPNNVKKYLKMPSGRRFVMFHLPSIERLGIGKIERFPFSIKILLENVLRSCDGFKVTGEDVKRVLAWKPKAGSRRKEIAFKPGRVILQDFTGVPCVVDLAAMRDAMKRLGGDYKKINPQVQCDLIIDHSLQVDVSGRKDAIKRNMSIEFKRNKERYGFLKWGQTAFKNFSVIPPGTGIIHQINLEYLARGVLKKRVGKQVYVFPDTLVGTDSHTTMINGIGVLGWGVGGIEAEAVMLGEPIYMLLPEVIGVRLEGALSSGVNATDLVLTIVHLLRKKGVVGKFVEFFGPGLDNLSIPDRAVLSNMCPEYGATVGIFPVDKKTLEYYMLTGRRREDIELVEYYMKEQGLFYTSDTSEPEFTDVVGVDLTKVKPCLAGPRRPQDMIFLSDIKQTFDKALTAPVSDNGFGIPTKDKLNTVTIAGKINSQIGHGAVVLASITSCTNTSNPFLLISAGVLAKRAVEKGLKVKRFVKTSFAPGSQVVEEYMKTAGLLEYLQQLNFHIVGYGCATCIGNSGPLPEEVVDAVKEGNLVVASVLSGNRNFEGRITPYTRANYLVSPPLVVAYALAGKINIDFDNEAIGQDKEGRDVYLRDIWPDDNEVERIVAKVVSAAAFRRVYKNVGRSNAMWDAIKPVSSSLFSWDKDSTYIQPPPFFEGIEQEECRISDIKSARVLVMVGDSITTDHISPAGTIAKDSPAGRYLMEHGVKPEEFNSYGARRGNDRVMVRGTFANIRLRNQLAPGTEGSWTYCFINQKKMSIYEASVEYKAAGVPLIVLAGKEYGTGSSRDWAAKGTSLLGIKAVLAESFERIHRSNLVGMGVLPLEFKKGDSVKTLGLRGDEVFDITDMDDNMKPRSSVTVTAQSPCGDVKRFKMTVRLDTNVEVEYFRNGGILRYVLKGFLNRES